MVQEALSAVAGGGFERGVEGGCVAEGVGGQVEGVGVEGHEAAEVEGVRGGFFDGYRSGEDCLLAQLLIILCFLQ